MCGLRSIFVCSQHNTTRDRESRTLLPNIAHLMAHSTVRSTVSEHLARGFSLLNAREWVGVCVCVWCVYKTVALTRGISLCLLRRKEATPSSVSIWRTSAHQSIGGGLWIARRIRTASTGAAIKPAPTVTTYANLTETVCVCTCCVSVRVCVRVYV